MDKEKGQFIEEYEINPFTMMIIPTTYGSKTYSKIFELDDELISPFKPIEIIKKSCEYFGASFEGRREGTKHVIHITHKAPIAIDPTNSIYVFPTTSPLRPQCIWLSHEHVLSHKRIDSKNTLVTFSNKQMHTLPISYASFGNQLQRTALLQSKLSQRLEETGRRTRNFWNYTNYMSASEKEDRYETPLNYKGSRFRK